MPARIKIIAVIYIFILAGIVMTADLAGTNFFTFVRLLPLGDKIGHFFLTGIFALLFNSALNAKTIRLWKSSYLFGSLIVFGVVTAEEFSQIFIDGRTFDSNDLIFDYAGIFVFSELARFFQRRITGRRIFS